MIYTPEQNEQLTNEKSKVLQRLNELLLTLTYQLAPTLKSERAQEYLIHGICRRIILLRKAINNIFEVFPPNREEHLSHDQRCDIEINLHAFTINIYGLLDNIAWVYVFENNLENTINRGRHGVGLFSKNTMKYFPDKIKQYLNSDKILSWYTNYAKNYRDALVHRIPPYVPPYTVDPKDEQQYRDYDSKISYLMSVGDFKGINKIRKEQDLIGSICGAFTHSYFDHDAAAPVMFHPQMLADSNTVIEIIYIVTLNRAKSIFDIEDGL